MVRDDQTALASRRHQVLLIIILVLLSYYAPDHSIPIVLPPTTVVEVPVPYQLALFQKAMFCTLLQTSGTSPQHARETVRAIKKSARLFKIDPFRIAGIITVESNGNPLAVSSKGAVGLMQIMPTTGQSIAEELGETWLGLEMLFDIHTNIAYGTWYYSSLKKRFQDDRVALAAYNWGPSHIQQRINNQEKLPRLYPSKVLATQERIEDVFRNEHQELFWWRSGHYKPRAGCP